MGDTPNFSQSVLEECTDDDLNFTECPGCGQDGFSSSQGVAMHYAYNHEGSIKYLFRCEECERLKFGSGQKNRFCSKWCEIYNRTGTFKHFDESFLREKIEEEGLRAVEVAEKIGVKKSLVHKWVDKYDIGNDYPCPSCDMSFATKQGVSKHHIERHGESIAGSYYTCTYCGEENWTPLSEENDIFPKYCDDDCFGSDMEGENNPNKQPERRNKISSGLIQAYSEGRREPGHRVSIEVEETGNIVDSSWEAEVDRLLYDSGIEYFYNGRGDCKRFDFGDFTHAPDFIIPKGNVDVVVEVKGGSVLFFQEEKMRKIGREMVQRNDVVYIVYGDVDLECNYHINYGNEKELVEVVRNQ